MEEGHLSTIESDVLPALSVISSAENDKEEKMSIVIRGLEFNSEESSLDDSDVDLHILDSGDQPQQQNRQEEEQEEESTEEAEPEPQPTEPIEAPPEEPVKEDTPTAKMTKIQVDPNASVKEIEEHSHYMTALPTVPESETPYTPILYTFRVKTRGKTTKLKKVSTKPPPLYLLFDHTIAVIWTIFNKNASKDNLGIVQLQWALHFLESIHNSEGVHPADVQLCIDTIQNYLIDEYAEMSEESVMYASPNLEDFITEDDNSKATSFSVNYCQMMKKCPPCVLETKESAILDQQLFEELENVKKVVGIESIDLTKVVSKDQVMNILGEWKKEQIEKIHEELKMLYVVEDMLKNSDSQNFEGYTDESQFETIFKRNKEK